MASFAHQPQPVLEHLDFLLYLARKLGANSNFMTPFPNITLPLLESEIKCYNEAHRHQPVSTKTLQHDYEVLKQVCRKDGGPLYQGNASQVTIKDVIEQSLAHINAKAANATNQFVV
ncbi:MAG: hypothetical protein U0003_00015 [Vampirovibrionales bacterium]